MEFADRDIVNQLNNRRTAWQESEPNLPFLSQQPKVGDPVINWQDFKKPRLRRFPGSRDDIRLRKFLGRGEDGLVIKARVKGQEDPVAVKIVSYVPAYHRGLRLPRRLLLLANTLHGSSTSTANRHQLTSHLAFRLFTHDSVHDTTATTNHDLIVVWRHIGPSRENA